MHALRLSALSAALAFSTPTSAGQAFRHPGILVNSTQLDFVKAKLQAGAQPWKGARDAAQRSGQASLSYQPKPLAVVECGSFNNPDIGCTDEVNDAVAAYTHALLWHFTGDEAHAKKSIQILNAWSATLTSHSNSNAPLQAGWAAATAVRAAELMRHAYGGWPQAEIDRYAAMLRKAYLPNLAANIKNHNGNWHLVILEAAMNIAIFLDDRPFFDSSVAKWRERTKAFIYISRDGPRPYQPAGLTMDLTQFWHGQTVYMDGLAQETCRDLSHTGMGLGSIINGAETALQQGIDLYTEESDRILAGMEFHAKYLVGEPVPANLCGGKLTLGYLPTWEIAYNHFVNRRGRAMPFSKRLLETRLRPTGANRHMVWETLTHIDVGAQGIGTTSIRIVRSPERQGTESSVWSLKQGAVSLVEPGNPDHRRFRLDGAELAVD